MIFCLFFRFNMKFLIFLNLLLVITICKSNPGKCPNSLLNPCSCGYSVYERDVYYVVNCTNTGFETTEMLEKLPRETQVLIFTGNKIPELPWNVFGELDSLPNLTIIDMSNNHIKEIKGKSYHHVQNVQRLILNHNNLTIADQVDGKFHHKRIFSNFVNLLELHLTDAFADNTDSALANDLHDIFVNSNLSLLYKLHLEQNEIRGFRDQKVFCDLPSLRDLYLGDNYITGITFTISCLRKLRFIDLERNNITRFHERDLNELDKLAYSYPSDSLMIDISKNPLKCDGNIKNFYYWMQTTRVIVRNKDLLECKQTKYGKRYLINLKHMFDAKHARVSNAITILLVILALILVTLLAALAYLSREKLNARFKPLIDVVSRKVQYTTIESQDV